MLQIFKKKSKTERVLKAPADGKAVPMTEAKDETFSSCMLGSGVVICPENGVVKAPCDGEITVFMKDSKHAVGIKTGFGLELLLHIGVDTVTLKGEGFESQLKQGMKVKAGDVLVRFDKELVEAKGLNTDVIMIVMDGENMPEVEYQTGMDVTAGETVVARVK